MTYTGTEEKLISLGYTCNKYDSYFYKTEWNDEVTVYTAIFINKKTKHITFEGWEYFKKAILAELGSDVVE